MMEVKWKQLIRKISVAGMFLLICFPCQAFSGKYLQANFALKINDFENAANNYVSMFKNGLEENEILQDAVIFSVISQNLDTAKAILGLHERKTSLSPASNLLNLADIIKTKQYDKVEVSLAKHGEIYPEFIKILLLGWTDIANENFDRGIKRFLSLNKDLHNVAIFNCALAFAMKGNFPKAAEYLVKLNTKKMNTTDRQVLGQIQIHSNNNQNDVAISLIEERMKNRGELLFQTELRELKKGKKLKFDSYKEPEDALADVFFLMGNLGDGKDQSSLAYIFYSQLAKYIAIQSDYYSLKLGEVFSEMGSYQVAIESYQSVQVQSAFFLKAQLGIGDVMIDINKEDEATKTFYSLLDLGFYEFSVYDALANVYSIKEKHGKAIEYYSLALEMLPIVNDSKRWATFFLRGITYDRYGNWVRAKADFDSALSLYPNHPEVLNYLGYSLIERNENLIEALKMIENAASQKPNSGYIIDSLGWGLFRLGRYEESIIHMEKAIELEPNDPIINDHLGDALWMIGREREARFQWKRALLFGPTLEDKKKIKEKLNYGITDL